LHTTVTYFISSTSLPIKGNVFAAKEEQERQEKRQEQHLQIKRGNYIRKLSSHT